MSNNIVISAIISIYNCERFIDGCIKDLVRQTCADKLEIIAVNTGSSEGEAAIVKHYQRHNPNIVYIERPRRETIYSAWNLGIANARGRYVTSANADDRHRKDALERLAHFLDTHPHVDLVYPGYDRYLCEGDDYRKPINITPVPALAYSRTKLLFACLPGPQPMWRRRLHAQHGLFRPYLQVAGDHEFWLRISETSDFAAYPQILGRYLVREDSVERRDHALSLFEDSFVTDRYIDQVFFSHHRDIPLQSRIAIRRHQSQRAYWRGDAYLRRGLVQAARKEFLKSLRYRLVNGVAIRAWIRTWCVRSPMKRA